MSIYSGFPTRRDEERYNTLLSKLILTLQSHIIELIGQGPAPHAKTVAYSRIMAKMRDFQEHKYLPPKFTELLAPLCKTLGIATEQKVDIQERSCQERVKVSTQSLNKYRPKSHFQLDEEKEQNSRVRMDSMVLPKQMCSESNSSKRGHFQSEFDLKERKFNPNIVPSKDDQRLKSTQNYDEPEPDQPEKWTTLIQTRSAKGPNVAKFKANLRYQRVFHGLHDAQNRRRPPRDDQRKLKTSEAHINE